MRSPVRAPVRLSLVDGLEEHADEVSSLQAQLVRVELSYDAQAAQIDELHDELEWAETTLEATQAELQLALAQLDQAQAKARSLERLRRIAQIHSSRAVHEQVDAIQRNMQETYQDLQDNVKGQLDGLVVPTQLAAQAGG